MPRLNLIMFVLFTYSFLVGCEQRTNATPSTATSGDIEQEETDEDTDFKVTAPPEEERDPLTPLLTRKLNSKNPDAWLWVVAFHPNHPIADSARDQYKVFLTDNSICTAWTQEDVDKREALKAHITMLPYLLFAKHQGKPAPESVAFLDRSDTTKIVGVLTELTLLEKRFLRPFEAKLLAIEKHPSLREEADFAKDIAHDLAWVIEDAHKAIAATKRGLIFPSKTRAALDRNDRVLMNNLLALTKKMNREGPILKGVKLDRAFGCSPYAPNASGEVVPYIEAILDQRVHAMKTLGSVDMAIPAEPFHGVDALLSRVCDPGTLDRMSCSACPRFMNADEPGTFELVSSKGVRLLEDNVEDRIATFKGCGAQYTSVVMRHTGVGWRRIGAYPGVKSGRCKSRSDRKTGLDTVTCRRKSKPQKLIFEGKKRDGVYLGGELIYRSVFALSPRDRNTRESPSPSPTPELPRATGETPSPSHFTSHLERGAILDAVCGARHAANNGCKRCPSFTFFKGSEDSYKVKNALDLGGEEGAIALTFEGCESHITNYTSTVIVEKQEGAWKRRYYEAGKNLDDCRKPSARRGAASPLVCSSDEVAQGHVTTTIYALVERDDKLTFETVTTLSDNSSTCPSRLEIETLSTITTQDWGTRNPKLILTIEATRAPAPEPFEDWCEAKEAGKKTPPLEKERRDYVYNGTSFKPR